MGNIAIQGPYTAPTATNLTQTVTRSGSAVQSLSAIVLTPSSVNFTKVFTLTLTISGTAYPSSLSFDSTVANSIPFTRVSSTIITVSSSYTLANGVVVNNWPYFQLLLKNLRLLTDNTIYPNPSCTISTSLTDGFTVLSGSLAVSSLVPSIPSTPSLTALRTSRISTTLNWTASTQSFGPGIGGYEIWKDGSLLVTIPGTSTLSYVDNTASLSSAAYYVRSYDLSSTSYYSANSATANISVITQKFIATTTTTTLMQTSPDGITWTPQSQTSGSSIYTTVIGSQYVIGLGPTTNAIYSIDGITWQNTTVPLTAGASGWTIAYGNNMFIATSPASNGATYMYSYNGITWSTGTFPSSTLIGSVVYGGGKWIASGGSTSTTCYSSTDGITWTARTLPSSQSWGVSVYGGGKFILLANTNNIAYSTDGITWTASLLPAGGINPRLSYNGSTWMASYLSVASSAYSTDGITWTVGGNTPTSPATGWGHPVYGNSLWVIMFSNVPPSGTNVFTTSPSGVTWTSRTLPVSGYVGEPIYANSIFIAPCTDSNNFLTSTDGITWTARTAATGSVHPNGLAFG